MGVLWTDGAGGFEVDVGEGGGEGGFDYLRGVCEGE